MKPPEASYLKVLTPYDPREGISLAVAAKRAGKSETTITELVPSAWPRASRRRRRLGCQPSCVGDVPRWRYGRSSGLPCWQPFEFAGAEVL